jgi:hypothetical protein
MDGSLEHALLLAERQLQFLKAGDFDYFLAAESAYTEACTSLSASNAEGRGVERLVLVVGAIARELQRLRGETGAEMTRLHTSRRAHGAYLSFPVRDAIETRSA